MSRVIVIAARVAIAAITVFVLACGGTPKPPERGVLEANIESWNFRRYQKLLDVEVWVAKNKAIGHTASYVHKQAEKEGRVSTGDVVNAFVTRYQNDRGILRALVKFSRRLAQDGGYKVDEDKIGGVRLISVKGNNESWVLWAARQHVIKIGGRGRDDVPEDVVEAYGERYPSRIAEGLLDGPLPPGPDFENPNADEDEEYDPDNPTPDWKGYDPDKADVPEKTGNDADDEE